MKWAQARDLESRWRTATRVGVVAAAAVVVVLVASGAWLWWEYRPDRDQWVRVVHQVAAVALLVLAVALLVVAILRRARAGGRGIVAAVGVFVTVGAAYVTGRLLPWDQLALSSATRTNDVPRGVAGTFDDRITFLFVRSREVSPSTYHVWAIAHLALGVLVVVALVLVWLRAPRSTTGRA